MFRLTKSILTGVAVFGLAIAFSGTASANPTTVTLWLDSLSDPLGGGDYGGQFTALASPYAKASAAAALSSLNAAGLNYSSLAISQAIGPSTPQYGFATFCVEENVYVYNGATNNYVLSQNNGFSPDGPLTIGSAWLYYQFATGNLSTYTLGGGGHFSYTSQAYDDQLQDAIWYLQDGQAMQNGYTSTTDTLLTLAESVLGSGSPTNQTGAFAADPAGQYAEVMLLTNPSTGAALQDQLILAAGGGQGVGRVPDGGKTVCLLGLAIGCLALVRRKLVTA